MNQLLSLFIALPLLAFVISLFFRNKNEKSISAIAEATTGLYILGAISFAAFWLINGYTPISQKLITLYKTANFEFTIQFYYDHIVAVYSIVGAFIFFFVARFSRYYMHRDEGFKRFFNTFLFFLLGFNLIIFSGNFETLFIGWEIIGLSSFLLIAFYRNRYLPVKNAFKVISIYRVSDIALILAMWMMHHLTHQNIPFTQLADAATNAVEQQHTGMALFIVCMIVLAAAAKSAQFPFTTWLPRAMEGPTSSSAIFYGSLSVHIGVFVLLRTYPFWQDMLGVKIALTVLGLITSVIASLIARVQPTVKTQIAYASAAQIGIIFIEVAWGLHWLALIHFAGNAFLRTYQLLVSPSVLNYLVHHQYFHHTENTAIGNGKLKNSIYALGIKEWNLDLLQFRFLWMPFKWIGRKLTFLESSTTLRILILAVLMLLFLVRKELIPTSYFSIITLCLIGLAFLFILFAFSSRQSAIRAWEYLFVAQLLILRGISISAKNVNNVEVIMYGSGIFIAFLVGFFCLNKIRKIDNDISLNKYHGYVYEQKSTALIFLLSAIGLLGFPITAAFIGIDVFFTYIEANHYALITLTALCFLFIELAAIRIYLRIFLGLHKKLNHPVAFGSS